MIYDHKILNRIAAYLQIRFPVATFARDLDYSKGAVSNYLNGTKPVSESFIRRIEDYYKVDANDFVTEQIPTLSNENIKKIAVFVADNKRELMKDTLFKTVIETIFLEMQLNKFKD